jgi:hypothetical protein
MFGRAHFSISKGMLINLLYCFVFSVFCAANGLVKFVLKPALIQSSHAKRVTWSVPKGIHSSDLVTKRVESHAQLISASQTSLIRSVSKS